MTVTEFEQLVAKYHHAMLYYLRGLCGGIVGVGVGSDDLAEDIAQEMWMSVWKRREQINLTAPCALLRSIASRRLIDYWRKKHQNRVRKNVAKEKLFTDMRHFNPTVTPQTATIIDLKEAIEALPSEVQECFVGNVVEGYSQREMARRVGVSKITVYRRLKIAKTKLRDAL